MKVQNPSPSDADVVTLADLLDVLARRRWLAVCVLAAIFLGSLGATALMTPHYEARSSLLLLNERDAVLALLQSDEYAKHVAGKVGITDPLSDHVTLRPAARGEPQGLVSIRVEHPDPQMAADLANAYATSLVDYRSYLENVTYGQSWPSYFEDANKDASRAQSQLRILLSNMTYAKTLDSASVPVEPTRPNWGLNLALGAVLGVMAALTVPFAVEGVEGALRERRARAEHRSATTGDAP